MFVSPKYLERYKLKFADESALLALSPEEIQLHGFEQVGNASMVLGAPEGFPQAISVLWQDSNPADAESWELDASLRKTLITVPGQAVGWLFDGLLCLDDARVWFRNHFGVPDEPPAEGQPQPADNTPEEPQP